MTTITSQSNTKPIEWDIKSSPTTVWHNYSVEEITQDGEKSYKYKTDKMTHQEYNLYLVEKLQQQQATITEQQDVINTILLDNLKREGAIL